MYKWLDKLFFEYDRGIFRATYDLLLKNEWLSKVARFISYFGDHGYFFIGMTILFLIFRKTRKLGLFVGVGLLIGLLVNNIMIKNIIARPRPYDSEEEYYLMWKFFSEIKMNSFSFPSGHTCSATIFGVGLFMFLNKKYSWLFLLIPVLMGWSRVALFVHYPSDVLFGMIFGFFSILSSYFLQKAILNLKIISKLTTGEKIF